LCIDVGNLLGVRCFSFKIPSPSVMMS
jgi:hypothetical protein